eukprot:TRINITY_DN6049_c0_g1_i1.p2 TRINITY_DN6049_c0_g1~~TRINITY_DN6049_c0_g1_i1.p2  ORF type:complete len:271 (+),score=56.77 TRINITY_DN6049_c0_g1_i1:184-996(+)
MTVFELYFDGASRGNGSVSAQCGAGAYIINPNTKAVIAEAYRYLKPTTNNVAEYEGLLLGLRLGTIAQCDKLHVKADSKLVVEQMKGAWKVKAQGLKPLHSEARSHLSNYSKITFEHVRREYNKRADELANMAVDRRQSKVFIDPAQAELGPHSAAAVLGAAPSVSMQMRGHDSESFTMGAYDYTSLRATSSFERETLASGFGELAQATPQPAAPSSTTSAVGMTVDLTAGLAEERLRQRVDRLERELAETRTCVAELKESLQQLQGKQS